jgi:chromosome segregation ATPase
MVGLLPAPAVFYCFGQQVRTRLMGSLVNELQRREAAARAEAEELRGRIAELAERLAGVEERLSRLVITRETVEEVPPWQAGLEVSVLPQAYRDLLEVAEDAGRPLRAAEVAAAAGLSTDRVKVETLRSKLKRLVERGWLAEEAGPGLFALPARHGNGTGEAVKTG